MHIRLINRIWSIYLPFCFFILFYLIKRFDYSFDSLYEIDVLLVLIFGLLIVVIVQTLFFINRIKIRKVHIENSKSIYPRLIEKISYPERLSFFNLRISLNNSTFDIFDKFSFKFCANKIDKTVEIKSYPKNIKYSFHNIDYILFEFDNIYNFKLDKSGKTIWIGSFSLVLKNKKIVHLSQITH